MDTDERERDEIVKTKRNRKPHLLFVCLGNTCRSPIAEAIAKKIFGSAAKVTSAGIAPYFEGAQAETIETVGSCFGVDISGHKTRGLEEIQMSDVDHVIAMDYSVFEQLVSCNPSITDKIIRWDVKDPYGQGLGTYIECAKQIEQHVNALFDELSKSHPDD